MHSLHSCLAAEANAKEALLYPQERPLLFFISINFLYLKEKYIHIDMLANIYACILVFIFRVYFAFILNRVISLWIVTRGRWQYSKTPEKSLRR